MKTLRRIARVDEPDRCQMYDMRTPAHTAAEKGCANALAALACIGVSLDAKTEVGGVANTASCHADAS
jgi:hypothetical protein